mgnify:FL=1
MTNPSAVVYLEHDGKVLLVDNDGNGPLLPIKGRQQGGVTLRFPTIEEVAKRGIEYEEKMTMSILFSDRQIFVIKGYPKIEWPSDWAWKDSVISDNCVHPVVREAIYRCIHRLVSKVIIKNDQNEILMAKVMRGHFKGLWTLPGGYMDHDEEPSEGCVRETFEELGIEITLNKNAPVITQQIFNDEGVSFVSFTYQATWNGTVEDMNLLTEEIADARWFTFEEATANAVSFFDSEALKNHN